MNNSYENVIGSRWKGYFLTAYGIAVKHGFKGTEADWLLSLTAYGIALELGFVGTKEEWIASLKGEKGDPFTFYDFTEEQLEELKTAIAGAVLTDAETSKKAAEEAKEAAESAVDVVNAITISAEKAAKDANTAKEAAESAEDEAKSYYLQAKYQAENADGFAKAAEKSMQDALDYASNALRDAQSAEASALSAAESARNAAQNAVDVKKNCANALRGKLLGASVSADDVSPLPHELDVRVTGKNLMNTSCVYGTLIAASGKISAVVKASVVSEYIYLPTGNYIISYKSSVDLRGIAFYRKKNEESFVKYVWVGRPSTFKYSFAVDEDCFVRIDVESDGYVAIEDISTFFANNEVQLERGTTKTDYVPYFDVNGTKVNLFGKNLSRIGAINLNTISPDNLPVIYEGYLPDGAWLSRKVDFTTSDQTLFRVVDKVTNSVINIPSNAASPRIEPQANEVRIEIIDGYSAGRASEIQLEIGNGTTAFTPYVEPVEAIADVEGNVELMSLAPNMTFTTDNGGAVIECGYVKDTNKVIENLTNAIISLGGNI